MTNFSMPLWISFREKKTKNRRDYKTAERDENQLWFVLLLEAVGFFSYFVYVFKSLRPGSLQSRFYKYSHTLTHFPCVTLNLQNLPHSDAIVFLVVVVVVSLSNHKQ